MKSYLDRAWINKGGQGLQLFLPNIKMIMEQRSEVRTPYVFSAAKGMVNLTEG
jgi:hypothetical protein